MVRETVIPNHYATLGLSPASEDVVIRAAYLALMRCYHPDRNPSADAAARARAIAAAYAVLGDPGRRSEYDHLRAQEAWPMEPAPRPAALPGGAFAAASMALLLATVALILWSPLPSSQAPRLQADARGRAAIGATAAEPVEVAARVEPSAAGPIAPRASRDPAPEPEPPAPAESPRLLAAAAPPQLPKARPASLPRDARPAAPQPALAKIPPSEPKPSFSCEGARTRGEIAVCRNGNLASLDRQQALLYAQSWGHADAARRAQLLRTRERFVAERDSCRSDSCTSGAYLARMREISGIMIGEAEAR